MVRSMYMKKEWRGWTFFTFDHSKSRFMNLLAWLCHIHYFRCGRYVLYTFLNSEYTYIDLSLYRMTCSDWPKTAWTSQLIQGMTKNMNFFRWNSGLRGQTTTIILCDCNCFIFFLFLSFPLFVSLFLLWFHKASITQKWDVVGCRDIFVIYLTCSLMLKSKWKKFNRFYPHLVKLYHL